MKLWQQQPMVVKLAAGLAVIFCAADFSQRIWLSADANERDVAGFDASAYSVPTPQMSEAVQNYLTELEQNTASQGEDESSQGNANQAPLIEGGVNLGEMRVRVRAIYRSQVTKQQVALIEAQHLTERNLELTEVNVGYALNNYKVSKITANSVEFTEQSASEQGTSESIVIPVFDY